jgi:hypothetical protein
MGRYFSTQGTSKSPSVDVSMGTAPDDDEDEAMPLEAPKGTVTERGVSMSLGLRQSSPSSLVQWAYRGGDDVRLEIDE